ncbi:MULTISPECIES: TerD family protein [Streptomyces]|uniref:Transport associated protein n=2 Tax=Streptomyces TaxID=1883 RepID=A0A380ND23_STRGR|nr:MULTISPECIES: TerD family protein [Streptomyces]WSU39663.1 TerD family protein [Streptomyces gougerotii]WPR54615.1 TerD family protein [Streptomyces sp. S399]SUP37530.1 Transport associated protein [Streptomyces griseus]GFH71693.1 transport-associated protein [Streptomyces diastaticus subsp. diastaticus]GGU14037.1 transport-associated protein [Streptomyces diastaticus subsp. diastaticus]
MTPGSNIPLTATSVTVDVSAPVRLDVSGLLLTADGKVRSDDDFIFYNQPTGAGVTYRSGGGSVPDAIVVDTASVPAQIEKIVVTASPDAAGQTFQGIEPTATIRGADGQALATFTPPQLGSETALVVVEVYRRNGAWKARAVGQGYANGLAGIATDFGVSVEEEPAAAPAPPAAAPAAPDPRAAMATPPPAAPRAAPAPPAPGSGKINLDKGRVSLQKNQTVSLVKAGRPLLSRIKMGLGWEPAFRGKDIDLDASVIAYGPQRNQLDSCYFGRLSILNGAVKHSGDNLTGEGGGDDEVIVVDLGGLPADVSGLVFTVNSFSGQKFTEVAKAYCRLVDAATDEELVRFDLTSAEPQTGVLMAKLIRQFSGEWEMTAIGDFVKSRTVRGMVKPGAQAL